MLHLIPSMLYQHDNTQTTGSMGLSAEMKTYYSDYLIDIAGPKLVHDQFGQRHPIPKNGGKTIEFRKYSPLPKQTAALTEGVTPSGQSLTVTTVTGTVKQYGGYVEMSDLLILTAIDNNLVQATKLLGSQAGRTLDTITREVLMGGTNVIYAGGVQSRDLLVGGDPTPDNNDYLSVDSIKRAARSLKTMNAEPVDDSYVAIIHPDCTYDLTNDNDWKYPHEYQDTAELYNGEIGKLYNVRFVETTEAKKFVAEGLTADARNLTVASAVSASTSVPVDEAITADEATALADRVVLIAGTEYEIASATAGAAGYASLTLATAATIDDETPIYPGGAGAAGRDVYATLVVGANAYGVTEVEGGGLEYIVKPLGSAGAADPLNQRATAGWKATKAAEILVDAYMVRIESTSTFDDHVAN